MECVTKWSLNKNLRHPWMNLYTNTHLKQLMLFVHANVFLTLIHRQQKFRTKIPNVLMLLAKSKCHAVKIINFISKH